VLPFLLAIRVRLLVYILHTTFVPSGDVAMVIADRLLLAQANPYSSPPQPNVTRLCGLPLL